MALKIPPPLVFLICIVLITVLPCHFISNSLVRFFSIIFAIIGITVSALGLLALYQKQTTFSPSKPKKTSTLVVHGIYRFTRNPMYLGLVFLLISWTLWQGNILGICIIGGFIVYIIRFQILPEEQVLAQKFGKNYYRYKQKVPRWL